MARPVEIDRATATRNARALFWRKGYLATSLRDLLAITHMGKGSFYAAYGSKEALFVQTLDWYHLMSQATRDEVSLTHRGLDALEQFLNITLINVSAQKRKRGCLLVNTVIELEGVEPKLYNRAKEYLQTLENACLDFLLTAKDSGELRKDLKPEDLAQLCATLLQGLRVDARLGYDRALLSQRITLFRQLIATPQEA